MFRLTNYVIKADDVKHNTKQRHFKGDTVNEAVLMQNRKLPNLLKFGPNVFLSS